MEPSDFTKGQPVMIDGIGWATVEHVVPKFADEGAGTVYARIVRDGSLCEIREPEKISPSLIGIRVLKNQKHPHWEWLQSRNKPIWFNTISTALAYAKTIIQNRAFRQIKIASHCPENDSILTLRTIKI